MDMAQIIGMLQGAAAQGGGAAGPLGQIAGRFGLDPAQLEAALGHMGAQAQGGVHDAGTLAQTAAEQTGASAGGLQDLLGQLMGAVQGMGAGGAGAPGGGFGLEAILAQLTGGSGAAAGAGGMLGGLTQMLDKDKDGSIMDDLAGMAGQFLNPPKA